ncbi:OB-fold domain-containing protein [Vibrio sp. PP-XX7]
MAGTRGKYRLEGTCCNECGATFFPRRSICSQCHSEHLQVCRFSHEGTIEAMVESDIPVLAIMGYGEVVPRHIAMIRLTDDIVIVSEIVDVAHPHELEIGAPVEMIIRKQVRESNLAWQYAYKFRPKR